MNCLYRIDMQLLYINYAILIFETWHLLVSDPRKPVQEAISSLISEHTEVLFVSESGWIRCSRSRRWKDMIRYCKYATSSPLSSTDSGCRPPTSVKKALKNARPRMYPQKGSHQHFAPIFGFRIYFWIFMDYIVCTCYCMPRHYLAFIYFSWDQGVPSCGTLRRGFRGVAWAVLVALRYRL